MRAIGRSTCTVALYAFVIIRPDRRDLVWVNVTAHPTAEWVARQLTEAFPWDEAPRYLIRDRDQITALPRHGHPGQAYRTGLALADSFAERLIGSIRPECTDHIIALGEGHLRRVVRAYTHYYNDIRTHRSLDNDAPISRSVQRIGSINSHAILGGLHHHYVRV